MRSSPQVIVTPPLRQWPCLKSNTCSQYCLAQTGSTPPPALHIIDQILSVSGKVRFDTLLSR